MNTRNIKLFREQFTECRRLGLNLKKRFLKFKNHPQLMPRFIHSESFKIIQKELNENPEAGFELSVCKKFGGICGGHNKQCKKLRGYE